ncbi:MAG: HAD family hydrolase [Clostridia bacterium]|nr:HAD family hydrolase [Clostridia bacterium]
MNLKMILFDLDGTLLPMDNDTFVNGYFNAIGQKVEKLGYNPKQVMTAIMKGTEFMILNPGIKSNENLFWDVYAETYGPIDSKDKKVFDDFYENEFNDVKSFCGYNPQVPKAIKMFKNRGLKLVLATNPLFPKTAVKARLNWAGLRMEDFELVTTYENINYCKPNLDYYSEILNRINVAPSECLMVGNNVDEDMIASKLGINVFLVTDCLINKSNEDISKYPHGNINDLINYVNQHSKITLG